MRTVKQTLHRAAFGGKPKRGFEARSSSSEGVRESDESDSDNDESDSDNDGNFRPRQRSRLSQLTGSSPTSASVWGTRYTAEGRPYYENYYTHLITWDKPADISNVVDPGITSTELTDTDGASDVDEMRRAPAAAAAPAAVPKAGSVLEGPARPIFMYRFWSCEIKHDPHGKGRMQFFEDTKDNYLLCGHDVSYFTNRKPDGTEIWLMHDDVDAAAKDAFPPLSSALALGNTSGHYLSFRCIVPGRGWGGLGKLLFNVLCAHMQTLGDTEITNVPANTKLQIYYEKEYGMSCGQQMCKKSLPVAGLPNRLIPLQTHVQIMSAAEAEASKATALAKEAAKATAAAAAGGETVGGIRRKQTFGKLW